MEEYRFILSPAPHFKDTDTTQKIMFSVVIAIIPSFVAAVYFFGFDAIRLTLLACLAALGTEAVFLKLRKKPLALSDGSALITGLLLGLSVPPSLPSWMVVLGSIVGIALGKQVFGGLGHNIFNPALVGRAFITASFTASMTTWYAPFDAITVATPLAMSPFASRYADLFFGSVAGSLGETSAFAILLGGIFLFYRGVLDPRVPLGVLGTVFVMAVALGHDPIFHLLSGSVLFGAIFMATCMVTSPITPKGRLIFGIGVGFILMIIRLYGSLPEGLTFAILLMNAVTPLINRWTRPRVKGQGVSSHA